jgi:hypothetical protein
MKKFWTALTVIALANLIAMGGFVGWLAKSDRLDMERVRHIRVVLAKTLSDEKAEDDAAKAKAAADEKAAEAAKIAGKPPLTAAERLAARVEASELDIQRAERLKREVQDLQRQLNEERTRLDARDAQLKADRKAFDEMVASNTAATTDLQFQKTLAVMEALKPAQAIAMLKEMIPPDNAAAPMAPVEANGPIASGTGAVAPPASRNLTRAVSYLDAMDDKHRAAIMKDLAKNEPKLAAELLERIRKQGEFARVP